MRVGWYLLASTAVLVFIGLLFWLEDFVGWAQFLWVLASGTAGGAFGVMFAGTGQVMDKDQLAELGKSVTRRVTPELVEHFADKRLIETELARAEWAAYRTNLRMKVEKLPTSHGLPAVWLLRDQVLALLDEEEG